MSEDEQRLRRLEEERRLRQVAVTRATHQPPEPVEDTATPSAETRDEDDDAPAQRMEQKALWVDLQIRRAMERGDFDNLPGAGKPIRGLDGTHDPDWWVKSLIEREQITGVLPPALGLRREDAELNAVIDREGTEEGVRRVVEDFNRRVVDARRQLLGGPPVVTATRDVDQEVVAWRARLAERRRRQREQLQEAVEPPARPRRWFRRRG
ncbi:MAG TPA: DUF1992 domain-containing protein [Nocardioidaceae bacterium]|nr:DUF1992 domain-containing protein [Nocardioidaceae bacterium]